MATRTKGSKEEHSTCCTAGVKMGMEAWYPKRRKEMLDLLPTENVSLADVLVEKYKTLAIKPEATKTCFLPSCPFDKTACHGETFNSTILVTNIW